MALDITHELRIRVDLKSGLVTMPQRTHLNYMDAAADRIVAEIVEGGNPVTLTGVSCTGKFYRPPNREEISLKGSINGSAASVTLNEHCYTAEGQYEAEIKLTQGSVTRTILSITGYVHRAGSGAIVDISGVIPNIDALLAQIQATKDAAAEAILAANGAKLATDEANRAALKLEGMTASAVSASTPSATVVTKDGKYHVSFGLVTPALSFEVETGPAGSDAQIVQSGTAEAPHIKLVIPRGDTGAVDGIDYYAGDPAPLGTASPGTANGVARGNHVHPKPTAEDVGARPDTWMPTAQDVGARPDTWMPTASQVGARPNTWTPTAEQVGAAEMKEIWTNAAPASTFAVQTLQISGLTNYELIEIQFRLSTSSPRLLPTLRMAVGASAASELRYVAAGSAHRRTAQATANGVAFGDNDYFADVTTSANSVDNKYMIPVRIWGIKGVQ